MEMFKENGRVKREDHETASTEVEIFYCTACGYHVERDAGKTEFGEGNSCPACNGPLKQQLP